MLRLLPVAALFAALTLLAASCSVNAGSEQGPAHLVVTRDFGRAIPLVSRTEDPIESGETVMRMLMRFSDVETRYGGRFVNAINGVESKRAGARRFDWFYYVNGIEAEVGAAERKLEGSDRVWWDHHDWSGAMRTPAVVGSFPEPFIHGTEGKRFPVRLDCAREEADACEEASRRLEDAGIAPSTSAIGAGAGKDVLRILVGKWEEVRADSAARQIEEGPEESGVFARFEAAGAQDRYELDLLDWHGGTAGTLRAGAGLVAATRFEDQAPTWIVTGTDSLGLDRAVALLTERALRNRFAVAADGRMSIALPEQPPR